MNALVFSVVPVVALLVVALVGLVWLRQPVEDRKGAPPAKRQDVADALSRLEDVNRQVEQLARTVAAPTKPTRNPTARRAKAG